MAQANRKSEWEAGLTPAVSGNIDRAAPAPSPARALQQLLGERTAVAGDVARWSRRRSLAFIVTVSAALWLALLEVVHGTVALIG